MLPAAAVAALLASSACNEDTKKDSFGYGADSSVAVTGFSMKANSDVMQRLDSVFFSIDLENAVIFNADSLPVGATVTDLIPIISFPSSVSEATIIMEGGSKRSGEIDYLKNPSDSVDFTGNVSLRLKAQDGETSRTYRLKVNVHKQKSDSLTWDNIGEATLPSQMAAPTEQKTVKRNETAYCLVRESNGSLSVSSSAAPAPNNWNTAAVAESGTFRVRSFTATDDAFFILDTDGNLYTSADARSWSTTGERWQNIIGGFGTTLLGIAPRDGRLCHVSYPDNYSTLPLESNFPVEGFSNFGVFSNKWSSDPIGILVGGYDADGQNTKATWAFDGFSWAKLSEHGPAEIADGTIVPYYIYRRTSLTTLTEEEFAIWLFIGGKNSEGANSRDLWMTYDNGVTWHKAVDYMKLPDSMPALRSCDGITLSTPMSSDLANLWKKIPSRRLGPWAIKYESDGYIISWKCPYIYLFGGINDQNVLNPSIYKGVLNRLTFTPII